MDARALLFLADLEPAQVDLASTPYSRAFLEEQGASISADIRGMPE